MRILAVGRRQLACSGRPVVFARPSSDVLLFGEKREHSSTKRPDDSQTRREAPGIQSGLLEKLDRVLSKSRGSGNRGSVRPSQQFQGLRSPVPEKRNPPTSVATGAKHLDKGLEEDVFGIPPPPPEMDEKENPHQQYLEMLEEHTQYRKFRKLHSKKPIPVEVADPVVDYLKQTEPVVPYEYPQLENALATGSIVSSEGTEQSSPEDAAARARLDFGLQCQKQKEKFMEKMGFNETQHNMLYNAIRYMAGQCAKKAMSEPLDLIWTKAKESGLTDKELLAILLHVSATFSIEKDRLKRSRSTPSILDYLDNKVKTKVPADSADEYGIEQVDEIATFHDLLHEPTEQSIHSRVRMLVSDGKGKEAMQLLEENENEIKLHLRVFTPVMGLFLEQGDLRAAVAVYRKMKQVYSVKLEAATYVQLLVGLAEHGAFSPGAEATAENSAELGFSVLTGPDFLDELLGEMSEDIIEISSNSVRRLRNAFATGLPESGLKPVGTLEFLKINNNPAGPDDNIADKVIVDRGTGDCTRSGVKLHLKHLSAAQKATLISGCQKLALARQKEFRSQRKTTSAERADENLQEFCDHLDKREGDPFTVFVDGANVGYYMQNFGDGCFSFYQIAFVVRELERMGENPLVILPRKYTFSSFQGKKHPQQHVSGEEREILQTLMARGKLFSPRSGMLDDFYWIIGSVADQTVSRAGRNLTVPVDDRGGRWPGTRPVLLTNDQMRDHKLGLLQPMAFKRWFSNCIVNYNFAAFVGRAAPHYNIGFSPVDFYSREIQRNVDERNGSSVWHFPLSDSSNRDEWFCLSVRKTL